MKGEPHGHLRPELRRVVRALLAASEETRAVSLDAIGDEVGTLAVSTDDVGLLIAALEKAGRRVDGPIGARGAAGLQRVLPAARRLAAALGRTPTIDELARDTGLSPDDVRHALALGRVMGR